MQQHLPYKTVLNLLIVMCGKMQRIDDLWCHTDVAFELGLEDNRLTGTIPAQMQYLPIRVRLYLFICFYNCISHTSAAEHP